MSQSLAPASPPAPALDPRRRFLVTLALLSLVVGLPLAVLATWWGISMASATVGGRDLRAAFCRMPPPADGGRLRVEEIELRRRVAQLEGDLSGRRAQCTVCADPDVVDVALVVDTSASMRWPASMNATAEAARYADLKKQFGELSADGAQDKLEAEWSAVPAGQNRMEAARRAALAVLDTLPGRARVHLLSFAGFDAQRVRQTQCNLVDAGRFAVADRPRLRTALAALQPNASGTPLALSIERAAASVRDRPADVPGFVVVVTDGAESCGGDPCAAARTARAADPGVKILLIDIAANTQAACLAEATSGQVIKPAETADIGRLLRDALRPPVPQACVPRPQAPG